MSKKLPYVQELPMYINNMLKFIKSLLLTVTLEIYSRNEQNNFNIATTWILQRFYKKKINYKYSKWDQLLNTLGTKY